MAPEDFSRSHILKLPEAWAVGTYEWRPGSDQVEWSPELMRIYGVDASARNEQDFAEFVHPDDRSRVQAEALSYLGTKAPGFSHTFRIVRPDGAVRLILDRGSIERDAEGRAQLIRGVNIDITDQAEVNREVHDRLKESEARFRMLFEAIDEGFCLLEVNLEGDDGRIDYRVTEANPAFYLRTGFPRASSAPGCARARLTSRTSGISFTARSRAPAKPSASSRNRRRWDAGSTSMPSASMRRSTRASPCCSATSRTASVMRSTPTC